MSASGQASRDASVMEAAERAGTNAGLSMVTETVLSGKALRRRGEGGGSRSSICPGRTKSRATMEVRMAVIEAIAASKNSAVGNIPVVIECDVMMAPIESPMVPSPAKATEEADAKTETKTYDRARIEEARNRIPARATHQRRSVHQPRIVLRNVHYLRDSRLNSHWQSLHCSRL